MGAAAREQREPSPPPRGSTRTIFVRRRGNLRLRGRRDRRGARFTPYRQIRHLARPLPRAYTGSTQRFSRDLLPTTDFWYQAIANNGEVLFTGSDPDPTGILTEIPAGGRGDENESLRTIVSPFRRSAFTVTVPDDVRITSLRFSSYAYALLADDTLARFGRDLSDGGNGVVDLPLDGIPIESPVDRNSPAYKGELFHGVPVDQALVCLHFVAEGFTSGQMRKFRSICDQLRADVANAQLWNSSANGNVSYVRYPIASNESGTWIPAACSSNGVAMGTQNTEFQSEFSDAVGKVNGECRLLAGFDELVLDAIKDDVGCPVELTVVVVNTQEYGGSSDHQVSWVAGKNGLARELILHELGHQLGLSDEYDFQGAGPTAPKGNVTRTPANPPWQTSTVPPQIYGNPTPPTDCVVPMIYGSVSTAQANTIGAFQGANHNGCDWFRPTLDCRMRTLSVAPPVDFCPVCKGIMQSYP